MQFSALRYFLETVRLGSIRRAAEALHVAPSAVSRQIALLEQQFGASLLERHADGVRATPAGEVFAAQARSTAHDFARLQSAIDDLQQLRRGVVRVASVEATVPDVLFPAIAEFRKSYPGIEYDLRIMGSVKALLSIAHQECEVGLVFEPEAHADVVEDSWFTDPVLAVMPPSHPLGKRKKLSIRELAGHRVAMLDETHVTNRMLTRAYAKEGLKPLVDITLSHVGFITAYAREGLGLTIVPQLLVLEEIRSGRLHAATIDDPLFQQTRFVLCRHKSRPPTLPAQAFLGALRDQFERFRSAKPSGNPKAKKRRC
jgi:DNA-binding transcriptional LysR family regulator